MDAGIYRIVCSKNGKMYIGSAICIKKRLCKHKWCLKNNIHTNKHLQNAFNIYGSDSFIYEIIEICSEKILLEREQYWIDKFNASNRDFGFNVVPYSDRKAMSEETKEKISKALKGRKKTEEARKNMILAQNNRSKEWNEKISAGQRGKIVSEETKKKQSEARIKMIQDGYVSPLKDKQLSEERKKETSISMKEKYKNGYVNPNKGKAMSMEQKIKLSQIKSKPCLCEETGEVFNNAIDVAIKLGVTSAAVNSSMRRKRKCKGLTFTRMTQ